MLSDSESILSSADSSESGVQLSDSLLVSGGFGLLSFDGALELSDSASDRLSLSVASDRSSGSSDNSLLSSDSSGQFGFDGASGTGLSAFLQFGLDLGKLL